MVTSFAVLLKVVARSRRMRELLIGIPDKLNKAERSKQQANKLALVWKFVPAENAFALLSNGSKRKVLYIPEATGLSKVHVWSVIARTVRMIGINCPANKRT